VAPDFRSEAVRFEEAFTVDHPVDQTWSFFEDATRLAKCVPGVESVEPLDAEGKSKLRMTQKVGYLSATFNLRWHVSNSEPMRSIEITSIGKTIRGAVGELRATNRVELEAVDGKTHVRLLADIAVGGMLGSVGHKMMASKAREVAAGFATNVSDELERWSEQPAAAPTETARSEEEVQR
jgi:carbon monoxide dehydrogenase subunit G